MQGFGCAAKHVESDVLCFTTSCTLPRTSASVLYNTLVLPAAVLIIAMLTVLGRTLLYCAILYCSGTVLTVHLTAWLRPFRKPRSEEQLVWPIFKLRVSYVYFPRHSKLRQGSGPGFLMRGICISSTTSPTFYP